MKHTLSLIVLLLAGLHRARLAYYETTPAAADKLLAVGGSPADPKRSVEGDACALPSPLPAMALPAIALPAIALRTSDSIRERSI